MKFKEPFFQHGKDIVKIEKLIDNGTLEWKRVSDIFDIQYDE